MIKKLITGDILASEFNHIIFGVNTEGFNDAGFAGLISRKFWPELACTGGNKLGEVLIKNYKADRNDLTGRTFYAIVCHSLEQGWKNSSRILEDALNKEIPNVPCAIVKIGAGMVGSFQGAPVAELLQAMENSKRELYVYSL